MYLLKKEKYIQLKNPTEFFYRHPVYAQRGENLTETMEDIYIYTHVYVYIIVRIRCI